METDMETDTSCKLKLDDILHIVRKEKNELLGYIIEKECTLDEFVTVLNRKGICFSKRTSKRLKGSIIAGFCKEKLLSVGIGALFAKQQSITFKCAYGHRYYKLKEDSCEEASRRSKTIKTRNRVITTKKLECPATLDVLKVTVYPEYEIKQETNWRAKAKFMKKFKEDVASNSVNVLEENRYYVSLSTTHNHPIVSLVHHKIDYSIRSEIQRLVSQGVTKLANVRQRLIEFVHTNFPEAPSTSLAFYPKYKTIDNYVRKFKRMGMSNPDNTEFEREFFDITDTEVVELTEEDAEITEQVIDNAGEQVATDGVITGQIIDSTTGKLIDAAIVTGEIIDLHAIQDQFSTRFEVVETAKENIENSVVKIHDSEVDKKVIARFRNQLRRLLFMSQCIRENANLDNLMNCHQQLVLVEKLLGNEIIKENGVQQVLTSSPPKKKKKRNSGDVVMKY